MTAKPENIIEYITWKKKRAVRKTFPSKSMEYDNEVLAYELFASYKWFPKVFEIKDNFIIYKFYKNNFYENRDIIVSLNKVDILEKIVRSVYDIYTAGYAHKDFHTKNMYLDGNNNFIIADFELMGKYTEKPLFMESYDITGRGLFSPYVSRNVSIMKDYPYSVKSIFNISLGDIERIFNSILCT